MLTARTEVIDRSDDPPRVPQEHAGPGERRPRLDRKLEREPQAVRWAKKAEEIIDSLANISLRFPAQNTSVTRLKPAGNKPVGTIVRRDRGSSYRSGRSDLEEVLIRNPVGGVDLEGAAPPAQVLAPWPAVRARQRWGLAAGPGRLSGRRRPRQSVAWARLPRRMANQYRSGAVQVGDGPIPSSFWIS